MKLILACLLLLAVRVSAEDIAEPESATQAKAGLVEKVCAGSCNDKQSQRLLTDPVKNGVQDKIDTINRVNGIITPQQLEKSRGTPEQEKPGEA